MFSRRWIMNYIVSFPTINNVFMWLDPSDWSMPIYVLVDYAQQSTAFYFARKRLMYTYILSDILRHFPTTIFAGKSYFLVVIIYPRINALIIHLRRTHFMKSQIPILYSYYMILSTFGHERFNQLTLSHTYEIHE